MCRLLYNFMRKMKIHILLTLVLGIIFVTTSRVFALDPTKSINQYGHNMWVRQNGLPADAVNAISQTKDGYLWFGTSAGLFRFDGMNFLEMSTNSKNEKTHQTVSTLYESNDSSLWIGTLFDGLKRLKHWTISIYGIQSQEIIEDREGHLIVGTSMGVYKYVDGKFEPILTNPNYITGLAEDSLGRIWVGTHDGVRIIKIDGPDKIISLKTKDGLPDNVATVVYSDHHSNVWIGTAHGLVRCNNGKLIAFDVKDGLSDNYINAIYEDKDGNLWVGTRKGLNRFFNSHWMIYTDSDGLTDNNVLSFAEDNEGSFWVGTSNGLNQFKDVSLTTYTTYDGLDNNFVSSVVEVPDGSLYILSVQGRSITRLKNGEINRNSNIPVGPAFASQDGNLWMGQNAVLYRIKNGQIKSFGAKAGFPKKWILAITEDNKSLIIYSDHAGIFRFINEHLTPYLLKGGKQYPAQEYVTFFYSQHNNILWVGTPVWLMKIENGDTTKYSSANGMAGDWVSSIYEDHQGTLWISSPKGGLTRYKDGKFVAYNTTIGLFNDEIYCVVGDEQGYFWLSSPKGIGRVNCKELDDYAEGRITSIHSEVYVIADGMKTDECFDSWQPNGCKTHDGHIWFATKKGAVMIDPNAFRKNEIPPPVFVEQLVVDQRMIPINQSINLEPDADKFEFHYTALSYLVPERVLFKYKLEGYDREWVDAKTRRVAYYTNLPPGKYRFRVMACNNDGLWSQTTADITFNLAPHYYQTYWFYGLMALVFCVIVYGLIRLRLWQHVKKEKELQSRIHEALANIKMLGGLIPICAKCKKIRDDKGYWDQIEKYVQSHSEAKFSHSICPQCLEELYPGISASNKDESKGVR